jgi:filamentous hemagglutinin family protein
MTSRGLSQETTTITATTGVGDLGTTVTSHGHTLHITGGSRPTNGTNLFHSFNQFNIGPGDTAQFLNTTPTIATMNILSRVTGGNPSSIFGTINTMSYPGANFFLMNPAGIVFGPTATLHVGGSVAFATADYLRLAEGDGSNSGIFRADPRATSLLTSAPVTAFGFLHSNPAAIAVQGSTLTVPPGESISLIGGNQGFTYINPDTGASASASSGVTITGGHLVTVGGQVNIASVASREEILAKNLHQTNNVNEQNFETFGPVQVSQRSSFDISGKSGGVIRIRGGHLIIDSSKISSTTGAIAVDTASVHITNASEVTTETTTAANAGHITLNAQRDIALDSGTLIISSSRGSSGNAGNITLQSHQGNITLAELSSVTTYSQMSSGNTGSITMDAPHGDLIPRNGKTWRNSDHSQQSAPAK